MPTETRYMHKPQVDLYFGNPVEEWSLNAPYNTLKEKSAPGAFLEPNTLVALAYFGSELYAQDVFYPQPDVMWNGYFWMKADVFGDAVYVAAFRLYKLRVDKTALPLSILYWVVNIPTTWQEINPRCETQPFDMYAGERVMPWVEIGLLSGTPTMFDTIYFRCDTPAYPSRTVGLELFPPPPPPAARVGYSDGLVTVML